MSAIFFFFFFSWQQNEHMKTCKPAPGDIDVASAVSVFASGATMVGSICNGR
jgi:hypothetical protein